MKNKEITNSLIDSEINHFKDQWHEIRRERGNGRSISFNANMNGEYMVVAQTTGDMNRTLLYKGPLRAKAMVIYNQIVYMTTQELKSLISLQTKVGQKYTYELFSVTTSDYDTEDVDDESALKNLLEIHGNDLKKVYRKENDRYNLVWDAVKDK